MALPYAFSNNTSPTGPQLDGNLAALGALTTIPCTVTGTNALTLTPFVNTPAVAVYVNYLRVSGVFGATSNTAMTARIGSLPSLGVYVDSAAGPVATTGGEGIQNCAFTLVYDGALNSNNGGWHLYTSPLSVRGGTISGNLTVTGLFTGATVNATSLIGGVGSVASLAAGVLLVGTSLSTISRMLSTQATIAFTVVPGASGQNQPATLSGVQLGDCIAIGVTAVPTGGAFSAFVPAAGTINLRCVNSAAASISAFTVIARLTALGGTP